MIDRAGGHETYVRAHARAAATLGFEPHIFCVGPRRRTARTDFGVIHEVPAPVPVALHGSLLAPAVARFAGRHPGRLGIHSFAIWASAGVLASRALARRGVAAVPIASAYATRAYEVEAMQGGLGSHLGPMQRLRYRAWRRWIRAIDDRVERFGYSRSRVVLVNYASVERILRQSYGLGETVRLVPYASADAFRDDGSSNSRAVSPEGPGMAGPPVVLAASRHDPRKGLDVLLRALADVAAQGLEFRAHLVGPGALVDSHRRLAAELGLADRVSIPGRVADVGRYFAEAEIFVLPSLAEASGSVSVLEALRSGTAVIASACDGIPEDLTHERDALLVPPGDRRALFAALRRLLADSSLRARLAARGRELHDERFSPERFVASMREIYEGLGVL